MSSNKERYDNIGIGYDSSRKADSYIAQRMHDLLHTGQSDSLYLEVGCGTGNYTNALHAKGMQFIGIDPSDEMLDKAKAKNPAIAWKKGHAEQMDLEDESVDGVLLSLTIHHWKDLNKGFREVDRVLKPQAKVVLFTTLPEQTLAYWLHHYFPKMIEDSIEILPTMQQIQAAFQATRLEIVVQEPYFVRADLEDRFLYCGKYRPELYFQEEIRRSISSFSMLSRKEEVEKGLQALRADIDSGKIQQIIKDYENDLGDYLFLVARKQ